ncbi:MAG: 4'-phosphopantetheinyl transferase superfamily protein, partial [Deltaproteobacteria bacterium]
ALGSLENVPAWIRRDPLTKVPIWPKGITGSLSHSSGLALAVVGDSPPILGLGVDIEKANRTIDPRIERHICTHDESEDLHSLHSENFAIRLLLTFSAKESLYKCFYGKIPRNFLRFKNVSLKWESNTWTADWKFSHKNKYLIEKTIGHWGVDQNWLWTMCWTL